MRIRVEVRVLTTEEPISTFYEKTITGYVKISLSLKMDKNEFGNAFPFLGNETLRSGNADIPRFFIESFLKWSFQEIEFIKKRTVY
jgi:hypothetical protein